MIAKDAYEAADAIWRYRSETKTLKMEDVRETIAMAIMEERERCYAIAEDYDSCVAAWIAAAIRGKA